MKKILVATLGLIAFAAPALAADMAPRYAKAPPPAPVAMYNWSGCYIGVVGGGEWGRSRTISNGTNNGFLNGTSGDLKTATDLSGATIGGTLGCNYQADHWVFGIEGDASWSSRNGSSNLVSPPFVPTFREDINGNWLSTIRGRLGYAVGTGGSVLLYGTAGGAFADMRIHEFDPIAGTPGATERNTFSGWTAGGGIEWGFAPAWSAKIEYLFADLGHHNFFQTTTTGCCTFQSSHFTDNVVRVGVNYHWNWTDPLMAKY
jgi:outer membrane immunogenic protein